MRVHIIGGPGSGKTTLAQSLSDQIAVPSYSLDDVAWHPYGSGTRPIHERVRIVTDLASQPDWMTEGAFLWWIEALLKSADTIIWLDVGCRIVHRYASRSIARDIRIRTSGG
ncbi:MAG: hypothetical protein BZY67_02495 [SAR202 cluster bacterium Io17-Chloro-G1]|nr:MAG: hypothetical protein BZY67_02495 [SAR202 cluster bacterium Io17-Chloro-G1]